MSTSTPDGEELQTYGTGTGLDQSSPVPLAETSMLPTTAVLLTLVDDGTLDLDEPIGRTLPWLTGPAGTITLRQLLSHTSGLPDSVACAEPTPSACDAAIAGTTLVETPGEGFRVTDLDAHVAARLAETATGQAVGPALRRAGRLPQRDDGDHLRRPGDDRWSGRRSTASPPRRTSASSSPSSVTEVGRRRALQVLSDASVQELLRDQTVRLDTHTEPWVAETGVPTYGLGVWRDRLRGDDVASVVSAPNRYGLYPFVDVGRSAWGIVVVDDHTNPRADAVSRSAVIAQLTAAALRNSPD